MQNVDGYTLRCYACAREYADDGAMLACPEAHAPSFLRTEYARREFTIDGGAPGMLRYAAWLPLRAPIHRAGGTVVFTSERLNRFLGAANVRIAFNGYWPERGALLRTATFKDLEAAGILGRFPRDGRTLVAASAGNTAAALAQACSDLDVPALIVAPERALANLRFDEPPRPCVRFVAIGGDATYDDAIAFAKRAALADGMLFEGGAANVARRDAIGTTLLCAVEAAGRLPDYYVQAVGSGAGAIAAHEAARRVIADGRYGSRLPRLLLVQNQPSTPIYDAWKAGRATLLDSADAELDRRKSQSIAASVLSTRMPPYAVAGGIRAILSESGGDVAAVGNDEIGGAQRAFEELVGIDIEPAGAAAVAGLKKALAGGGIDSQAEIVLHVTGGGRRRRNAALRYRVEDAQAVEYQAISASVR
jgi:cysteate synthase